MATISSTAVVSKLARLEGAVTIGDGNTIHTQPQPCDSAVCHLLSLLVFTPPTVCSKSDVFHQSMASVSEIDTGNTVSPSRSRSPHLRPYLPFRRGGESIDTVIHPSCKILAEGGPITIGTGCLIEELVVIRNTYVMSC
jgi:hypothetical protein